MNVTDETPAEYRLNSAPMRTEIVFPNQVTPSLNQTLKEHYGDKTRRRKAYEKEIWAATKNQHKGPVRLEIYRHNTVLMDNDNFIGGTKQILDALKNRGVIVDDTPAIIRQTHYEQVRIDKNGPKMMVVIVSDL